MLDTSFYCRKLTCVEELRSQKLAGNTYSYEVLPVTSCNFNIIIYLACHDVKLNLEMAFPLALKCVFVNDLVLLSIEVSSESRPNKIIGILNQSRSICSWRKRGH